MSDQDRPKPKPANIKLTPAQGTSDASLDLSAGGGANVRLAPAHGSSNASVDLSAGDTIRSASGAIVGTSQPQPETISEDIGVLSWVAGNIAFGYEVGNSIGQVPGGLGGAALGGAAACAVVRWSPARERAFKFIRWLSDESGRH
jgi:hypothetical protein